MKTENTAKNIIRKLAAAAFLLLVCGLMNTVPAQAAQTVTPASANNEELFSDYVDSVFYEGVEERISGISIEASDMARGENLSAGDRYVYDIVREAASDIAAGERASSIITFSVAGIEAATGETVTESYDPFSLANVLYALLDDCPYELYWYDKTAGTDASVSGDQYVITMPVIYSYAASGTSGTYLADTEVTGAATKAAANARSVAAEKYGEGVYDALDYYREWICDAVSYNYSAPGSKYGDPWQLIYVFDGDDSTNVVCEGYSKAFKYLCDLYANANPNTEMVCYLVEGTLSGNWLSGAHMWNVVRMNNGKNYLADITNCDSGSDKTRLFLMGCSNTEMTEFPENSGIQRTIAYSVSGKDGTTLSYRYQWGKIPYSLIMYTENEISLSSSDYDPDDLEGTFKDVRNSKKYYYTPVYWAAQNGITAGTSSTTFSPDAYVTRAQYVTFLWRLAGKPEAEDAAFTDLPSNSDYRAAISWAASEGIAAGTSHTTFSPDDYVTREQAAVFLWRYYGEEPSDASGVFSDVRSGSYYETAVNWGAENGIIYGYGSVFGVGNITTRGQAVTFIWRAAQLISR